MRKLIFAAAAAFTLAGSAAAAQGYGYYDRYDRYDSYDRAYDLRYRDSDGDGRSDYREWNRDRDRDGRPDQWDRRDNRRYHDRRVYRGHRYYAPRYGYYYRAPVRRPYFAYDYGYYRY